ncbi:MAG: hypothetical protein RLZZ52_633, partial [Actinomycetota bacterium]
MTSIGWAEKLTIYRSEGVCEISQHAH